VPIDEIIRIARAGVEAIRRELHRPVEWQAKQDGSLVTPADLRANEAILAAADELLPGVPVHSEESRLADWHARETVLVVDPLDGTTNFAYGLPLSAVSVAVVRRGAPVAGAVAPVAGGVYFAAEGRGARFAEALADWPSAAALHCAARPLDQALLSVSYDASYPAGREAWWGWLERLKPPVCYRLRLIGSSALALSWLAAGKLDGYLHPTDKAWDVAAAGLIAREAGAVTCSTDLGRWDLAREGIIAATPAVADSIRRILRA
jgi:myo-inositol-1(or 4)-monophosphatase